LPTCSRGIAKSRGRGPDLSIRAEQRKKSPFEGGAVAPAGLKNPAAGI